MKLMTNLVQIGHCPDCVEGHPSNADKYPYAIHILPSNATTSAFEQPIHITIK